MLRTIGMAAVLKLVFLVALAAHVVCMAADVFGTKTVSLHCIL
jgi:hypothetical protein